MCAHGHANTCMGVHTCTGCVCVIVRHRCRLSVPPTSPRCGGRGHRLAQPCGQALRPGEGLCCAGRSVQNGCRALTVGHCWFLNVTLKLAWMSPGVTGEKVMGTLTEEKGPISPSVTCMGRHTSQGPSGSRFHEGTSHCLPQAVSLAGWVVAGPMFP